MEYLPEIVLLGSIIVNIISILVFCLLDTSTLNKTAKKNMIAGTILLSIIFVLDLICTVYFIINGTAENALVFLLFFPLIGIFLYESIKEIIMTSR